MSLQRLVYISVATGSMSDGDLRQIHALSERNNRRRDITGALGFTGRYFIQCLEGRPDDIAEVMSRIQEDKRHAEVVQLCQVTSDKRRFGQWSMRFFSSFALDGDAARVHQSETADCAQADWLIERMTETLQPGQTLHSLR